MVLLPQVYLSADYVFPRLCELLNDLSVPIERVQCPAPFIFPSNAKRTKRVLTYKMSHAEREAYEESKKAVFAPMILWGPIERPEFVIDEAGLPY